MNLIAADIGNSSTWLAAGKVGLDWTQTRQLRFANGRDVDLETDGQPACWSVCSVNSHSRRRLDEWIKANRPHDQIHLIGHHDIDLKSALDAPQQTGIDRMLAAWMAVQLADSAGPLIIVDAGTAVTVDLVDTNRIFQGGFIFPGFMTSLKSLSIATDALPDLRGERNDLESSDKEQNAPGRNTRAAIIRGVRHSQLATIRHLVQLIADAVETPCEVFATGGGIGDLQPDLPQQWNFIEHLVLQGAYRLGRVLAGMGNSDLGSPAIGNP